MERELFLRMKDEIVYLWADEQQMYIKSVPGKGYWGKFPGKEEFKMDPASDAVVMAIAAGNVVEKKEYKKA